MQTVMIDTYGDNQVVQLAQVERPAPQAGEVLVKIHAAGVNPVDWKIRDGAGQRMGLTLPIALGGEISGVVVQVGSDGGAAGGGGRDEGGGRFRPGDAVYGIIRAGGFAEYVVAPAADLARKPASLDFIGAAAVALGGLTAWQAMFGLARLTRGQRLLITGGSGGVGSLAIQLAKAAGAHVTAMASARNEAFVRGLGADDFIDYTAQPFEAAAREVDMAMDVVFDTVGGDAFARAFSAVKRGGFLVTSVAFVSDADRQRAAAAGIGLARVQCQPDAAQLDAIAQLVQAGQLAPHVETVLPLAQIRAALALSQAGRTRGKIVIAIDG
ncbi:MAG: NADP-dependent oxidoreductase [Duganella sp.]